MRAETAGQKWTALGSIRLRSRHILGLTKSSEEHAEKPGGRHDQYQLDQDRQEFLFNLRTGSVHSVPPLILGLLAAAQGHQAGRTPNRSGQLKSCGQSMPAEMDSHTASICSLTGHCFREIAAFIRQPTRVVDSAKARRSDTRFMQQWKRID